MLPGEPLVARRPSSTGAVTRVGPHDDCNHRAGLGANQRGRTIAWTRTFRIVFALVSPALQAVARPAPRLTYRAPVSPR